MYLASNQNWLFLTDGLLFDQFYSMFGTLGAILHAQFYLAFIVMELMGICMQFVSRYLLLNQFEKNFILFIFFQQFPNWFPPLLDPFTYSFYCQYGLLYSFLHCIISKWRISFRKCTRTIQCGRPEQVEILFHFQHKCIDN